MRLRRFRLHTPRSAGFTLIELMVVLVILGLAGVAVVMTSPGDGDRLGREADTLAARLVRAREEAVLTMRSVRVSVNPHGYEFLRQDFGNWEALNAGGFEPEMFNEGTTATMPTATRQPHVSFRFDPAGGSAVQEVVLARRDRRLRVAVDAAGEVSVDDVR